MRIFAFHLLNDYSGSPKVLMQLVKIWTKKNLKVTIVTCGGRNGFLTNLPETSYIFYRYKLAANPFVRLFNLVISQMLLLVKLILVVKKEDIIYINTVLPFGAAFLGKLKGCRIIYHIHETSMKPALLKNFLFGIVKWSASDIIYVSNYLKVDININNKNTHVIYNCIEDSFLNTAVTLRDSNELSKNVLMICSLKDYKGVPEFVQMAHHLPYHFRLVVNAGPEEIAKYFNDKILPKNLEIYPTQTDTHPFYKWANVILNLSRPDGWIETFGLTIIEGMAYGLPAIVPTVGGIAELVEDGKNGFLVDSRDLKKLSEKLRLVLENSDLYDKMREEALKRILHFNEQTFSEQSLAVINSQHTFSQIKYNAPANMPLQQ